jgi:ABC-type nitrate/sulfonate/bicarbonate transport system substrate-binding protein
MNQERIARNGEKYSRFSKAMKKAADCIIKDPVSAATLQLSN